MRHARMKQRFVQHIPESLESGVLYISMEYATAAHSCCCGCGEEVVTPFSPTDWRMTFDGETISLRPSIGNWNFACRSHYVIDRGKVREALPWTDEQIATGRRRDRASKARYYDTTAPKDGVIDPTISPSTDRARLGSWLRFRCWVGCGFR